MMALSLHFLLVLLGVLTTVVLVQAQDQSGFISIDCGLLPENKSYTEETTGINYISDAKFIATGVSNSTSPAEKITLWQQLKYVRSFPSGARNCFRINVTSGTKYLIRASFYYGNYDGLNEVPQFDLHLGANLWDTVKFPNASLTTVSEIIYTPSLDYIQPCLVNTDTGTPFISTIELRTLNNKSYSTDSAKSVLSRFRRYDTGSITNLEYRYKDDFYDRIWWPIGFNNWRRLSTSLSPDDMTQNDYELPAVVMSTAATPVNASAPLQFSWESDNVDDKYYIYMHFYEVEKLTANETRTFNVTFNGKPWFGPTSLAFQITNTIFSPSALTRATKYEFKLFKTETSTLPPILNAFEIYTVKDFSQLETEHDDVDAITNIKNTYGMDRNWQGDPCAPVAYVWEGLNCSFDSDSSPRITSLNLSSSGLTGQIASSISKLTMLQYLDLSNNSLSGPLPDFLTQLQSLKVLNLGNNNLTGLVPSGLLYRSKEGSLSLSVEQNPNLCESDSCNQENDDEKKKKNDIVIPVVASIAGILVVLVIGQAAIICGLKKRKPRAMRSDSLKSKQRAFSYTEILNITHNLKTIIGEGGFGKVYFGILQDHTQVAVKLLSPSSMQGYKEFQSEAQLLMVVHHRDLVSLIGYCNEGEMKALIYEYMANGNLQQHLSVENPKVLNWNERLNIAVDAAHGLEYLHNGCKPPIIHRDLKASNILLDQNMHAKIADFGLSRAFGNDIDSHISTRPAGTPGYVDPIFQRTGNSNKKSDIYSFGIILFELITGRQALVRAHGKIIHILEWVIPIAESGDIQNITDPRLQGEISVNSAWKVVEIAMSCTSPIAAERPDMSQILGDLKECLFLEMVQRNGSERARTVVELTSLQIESEVAPLAR